MNGRWIERTEIPADKARYGSFAVLAEEAERAVHELILEAQQAQPGTEARKVGDLYASFMNTEAIEAAGIAPLAPWFERVAAVRSIPEFLGQLGAFERAGIGGFAALFVDNDPGDPNRYVVFVEQAGIGLPDESYFREEGFAEIREAYRTHIERMFTLAGLDQASERAQRVYALESEIAAVHWDNVASRDSQKTYNLRDWAAVGELINAQRSEPLDLALWRDAMGVPGHALAEMVVRQPSFVSGVGALLTEDRLAAWRDWLAWEVIRGMASYLNDEIVQANFDFTGAPSLAPRSSAIAGSAPSRWSSVAWVRRSASSMSNATSVRKPNWPWTS